MAGEDLDYTKNLWRNLIIGLVTVYAGTVGLCFAALQHLGDTLAIAVVPALFPGPYVGLLITLISAVAPKHASDTARTQAMGPSPARHRSRWYPMPPLERLAVTSR